MYFCSFFFIIAFCIFFVLKKPLFRKFSSNFSAALENLMMFLCFGLDNLNLEKYKMRELLPKGPQDRTSTDDQRRATWHSNSVWFHACVKMDV